MLDLEAGGAGGLGGWWVPVGEHEGAGEVGSEVADNNGRQLIAGNVRKPLFQKHFPRGDEVRNFLKRNLPRGKEAKRQTLDA